MRTVAIIQARSCSTRLPGKVLKTLPFAGQRTVLEQIVRRLRKCCGVDEVIVATTGNEADEKIVRLCAQIDVKCFRGSEEDVLSRYYHVAGESLADIIVRVTGDCPCIDPVVVDMVVARHKATCADFSSNILTRTFPHGMDTEVLNFDTLEKAYRQSKDVFEREHVCPYVYAGNPEQFKITSVQAPEGMRDPDIRVTLDTAADYALLCAVYDYLYGDNEFFGAAEIVRLFAVRPWLKMVNASVMQKRRIDSLQDELEEAVKLLDMQELKRASGILSERLG